MRKRKRIRKQLEKIYFKNREKISRTDRLIFRLLIAKLGKKKLISIVLKLFQLVINLLSIDSRPGSLKLSYALYTDYKSCLNKGFKTIIR